MQLTVIFKNMLPSEELIHLSKRLVRYADVDAEACAAANVAIENLGGDDNPHFSVAVALGEQGPRAEQRGTDPYVALRSVFSLMSQKRTASEGRAARETFVGKPHPVIERSLQT